MKNIRNILRTAFFLLATLPISFPSTVSAADISDGGKFFSAEVIEKANKSIQEIEREKGHQIRIESFATVPVEKAESVSKMDKKARDAFFSTWVAERAEATHSRGILVLICREPSHLNVWAGQPIQRAGFGAAQAKPIRETLLSNLKSKEYDKALSECVSQLSDTFSKLTPAVGASGQSRVRETSHAPSSQQSKHVNSNPTLPSHKSPTHPSPISRGPHDSPVTSSWGGLPMILVSIVVGIFLFSLIRRLFSGGSAGYGAGPGVGGFGGGGGGFMNGLAGGIFGAMAGNWLYDQFSGHSASAGENHWGRDSQGSNETQDGSWGDSGSSADSGFSGGTDFGGGDFGGGSDSGGSDFGGDGGDF